MASDRARRNSDASVAAELRRSRPRPTGVPYPTTSARAKPRIARTTNISIRVKPEVGDDPAGPHHLTAAGPGPLSHREVIELEHCTQQRADDARDHKPHHDGDRRYREGDDPLEHQPRLFVVDVGGL